MKNIILLGSVVLFIFVNCGEDISSDEVVYKNPCDIFLRILFFFLNLEISV